MKKISKCFSIILSISMLFSIFATFDFCAYSATTCEYKVVESVESTCTQQGYRVYKCADCGDEYTETLALGHTFASFKGLDNNKLSYSCSTCMKWYRISLEDALKMFDADVINKIAEACPEINLVDDGIINAKDYAKINHIKNYELDENPPTSGETDLDKDDEFGID